jgi:hypothetical protein
MHGPLEIEPLDAESTHFLMSRVPNGRHRRLVFRRDHCHVQKYPVAERRQETDAKACLAQVRIRADVDVAG